MSGKFHKMSSLASVLGGDGLCTPMLSLPTKRATTNAHRCCWIHKLIYLCVCLAVLHILSPMLINAYEMGWDDCPDNGMRKPPRFGKRSGSQNDNYDDSDWTNYPDVIRGNTKRSFESPCFRGVVRRRTIMNTNGNFKRFWLSQLANRLRPANVVRATPAEPAAIEQTIDKANYGHTSDWDLS